MSDKFNPPSPPSISLHATAVSPATPHRLLQQPGAAAAAAASPASALAITPQLIRDIVTETLGQARAQDQVKIMVIIIIIMMIILININHNNNELIFNYQSYYFILLFNCSRLPATFV
jgi:Na+/proline symporter